MILNGDPILQSLHQDHSSSSWQVISFSGALPGFHAVTHGTSPLKPCFIYATKNLSQLKKVSQKNWFHLQVGFLEVLSIFVSFFLLVDVVAFFRARVLRHLVVEDACFRMRVTLGVILIRSLVYTKNIPRRLRSGSEVALKHRVREEVIKTG